MNRRKFLAFLGIAPFAPALAKVAPPVVEEKLFWFDEPMILGRNYVGPSIIPMLEESMMRTKQQMAANILQNHWSETDEGL